MLRGTSGILRLKASIGRLGSSIGWHGRHRKERRARSGLHGHGLRRSVAIDVEFDLAAWGCFADHPGKLRDAFDALSVVLHHGVTPA